MSDQVNITNIHHHNYDNPTLRDVHGGSANRADLEARYGADNVANAADTLALEAMFEPIKNAIANTDQLPQSVKDDALQAIESRIDAQKANQRSDVMDAVRNSDVGEEAVESGHNQGLDIAASIMKMTEEMGEEQAKRSSDTDKGEGGDKPLNWLEELALALARVQAKFLERAMTASNDMAANAGDLHVAGEDGVLTDAQNKENNNQRSAFLAAQASYTANIQMFTTMANQTATSIKSIGEAMSNIARKQ